MTRTRSHQIVAITFSLLACAAASAQAPSQAKPAEQGQLIVVPQSPIGAGGMLSPDGRWVVAAGHGGAVLWDVKHERVRLAMPLPTRGSRPVFRPSDGAVLFNCGRYSILFHPDTGRREIVDIPHGFTAYSDDGKLLAIVTPVAHATPPNEIRLLDGRSFRQLNSWKTGVVIPVSLRFADDGTRLVMTGEAGRPHARIYMGSPTKVEVDLKTKALTEEPLKDYHDQPVRGPLRAPPYPKLADSIVASIAKHDKRIPHATAVRGMSLSPDGRFLLTWIANDLGVWDLQTGRRIRWWASDWAQSIVRWLDDGRICLTSGEGISLYDPKTGKRTLKKMTDRVRTSGVWLVGTVEMPPDGKRFLLLRQDKLSFYHWDGEDPLWTLETKDGLGWFRPLLWLRPNVPYNCATIFVVGTTEIVTIDERTGKIVSRTSVTRDNEERIQDAIWDGRNIILATAKYPRGHVDLYRFESGEPRHMALLLDDTKAMPTAVARAGPGKPIYVSSVYPAAIRRFAAGEETHNVTISYVPWQFEPRMLQLDPTGALLCATGGARGIALDAKTLALPARPAAIAAYSARWRGPNPLPLNGRIAVVARPQLARIDLVDVQAEQTILSLQDWGKAGWASFTPEGHWMADDAGAERIVIYKADTSFPADEVANLRQPKLIEALLKRHNPAPSK